MRALHVIPAVAPVYGGPSTAVIQVCRALQTGRTETLIVTTDANGPGRLDVQLGQPVSFAGVQAVFFPRQWSESYKYSRPLARWLGENVARFDVVHIHAIFSHASLAAAGAARRHRVPYVLRPLGSLSPWGLRQKSLRKRLLWQLGAGRMVRGAAAIHYTSAGEQRDAESHLVLPPGAVIPLPVPEALEQAEGRPPAAADASLPAPLPYVLALSRLHPVKGLELLASVFLEVTRRPELAHWRLVLAGQGEPGYVAALQRHVRAQEGTDRVLFPGWLDGDRKTAALAGASLLAMPSHHENFGLAIVEALACGVPVLVSPHVNLSDEVQAAGAGWVVALDFAAMSATLSDALGHPDERAARGAAARRFARSHFSPAVVAAQLDDLYARLSGSPRTSSGGPPARASLHAPVETAQQP